jgi:hypothetical protein
MAKNKSQKTRNRMTLRNSILNNNGITLWANIDFHHQLDIPRKCHGIELGTGQTPQAGFSFSHSRTRDESLDIPMGFRVSSPTHARAMESEGIR